MDLSLFLKDILEFKDRRVKKSMNSFQVFLKREDEGVFSIPVEVAPCYAKLGRLHQEVFNSSAELLQVPLQREDSQVEEEVLEDFLNYLVKESPFSEVFTVKDISFIRTYGAILKTDIPANLMIAAATVLRSLWEHTHIPTIWFKLVREGVNKDVALLGAHCIIEKEGRYQKNTEFGHRAFDPNFVDEKLITNFLNRTPENPVENYSTSLKYSRIHVLYADSRKSIMDDYKFEEKKKYSDPWDTWYVGYDSTLKPFADYLKKIHKKIVEPKKEKRKEINKKTVEEKHFNYLMSLLKVKNGFTLSEVRKYKKDLREVYAGGKEAGWRITPYLPSFNSSINWSKARQFNKSEFMALDTKCENLNLYKRYPYNG